MGVRIGLHSMRGGRRDVFVVSEDGMRTETVDVCRRPAVGIPACALDQRRLVAKPTGRRSREGPFLTAEQPEGLRLWRIVYERT
jgi:hypothetical protein